MNRLVLIGAIIAVLGVVGLLVPVFKTQHTEEVARVGDLSLKAKEQNTHVIPQEAAIGAIAVGVVLVGVGMYRRT
ncbi:MAG: hypothetical protein ACM30I_15725 [Gemmatimonas sp.]